MCGFGGVCCSYVFEGLPHFGNSGGWPGLFEDVFSVFGAEFLPGLLEEVLVRWQIKLCCELFLLG